MRLSLPTFAEGLEYLEAGALLSFSPNPSALRLGFLRLIDKVLRGAQPSDLPVEQVSKFDLIVNLKAAKALRITSPQSVRVRADEVIE